MKKATKEIMIDWWNDNLDYLPLGAKWRGKWQKGAVKNIIQEIKKRSLDIEIAEKLFNSKVKVKEAFDDSSDSYYPQLQMVIEIHKNGSWDGKSDWEEYDALPHYSSDLKDSWLIIEKLKNDGSFIKLNNCNEKNKWFCCITNPKNSIEEFYINEECVNIAICKTALKVVNAK